MSADKNATKDAAPAAPEPKKGGAALSIISIVLTGALAGGASFAGARAAGHTPKKDEHVLEPPKIKAPGPTVALEPFIANVADESGNPHAVKVTFFVELEHDAKEDLFKSFIPRVRDTILAHLRNQPFERFSKQEEFEKMREELKEKIKQVGAFSANQILVTEIIMQ